jgi:transposase InsO family protein
MSWESTVVIAMDYFTKWPEAYAVHIQEVLMVVEALVANFFCHFAGPQELHSGQGHNFESRHMQEVLKWLGVTKTCTTPLYSQSDSLVERYVKMVEHLWKVVASHQRN